MKPLLTIVVALCLTSTIRAHPENIEEVKELPQAKDPVVEAEESSPQARKERCSTCVGGQFKLGLNGQNQILASLQNIPPGAEVHTQQSFEGCSSDKGCAGIKVKDGKVLEKFGNLDAFRAAAAADSGNEFSFHASGAVGDNAFQGGNAPFWWMNDKSPFKTAGASGDSFQEKFSKSSSSSFSSSSGSGGATGAGGATGTGGAASFGANIDLSANPFLNGELSKLAGNFGSTAAGSGFQGSASQNPSSYQSSSYESSSYSTKGEVDLSKNPFLNGNINKFGQSSGSGFQAQGASGSNQNAFGANQNTFGSSGSNFGSQSTYNANQGYTAGYTGSKPGYTGSSPSPFTASTGANVNLIQNSQKASEFDFESQQQTQQNIDEIFQGTGNVHAHEHGGGELQQTCAGQGYVCVHKAQCNNGVVNTNGAGVLQAKTKKQYCNTKTEICCRIEISLAGAGSSQGSLGVGSATYSGSGSQGTGIFASSSNQGNGQSASGSAFGQTGQSGVAGQAGFGGQNGQSGTRFESSSSSFDSSSSTSGSANRGNAFGQGTRGNANGFGATSQGSSFGSQGASSTFGSNNQGASGTFGTNNQGASGTFGTNNQGASGTFGSNNQGTSGTFGSNNRGASGTFGTGTQGVSSTFESNSQSSSTYGSSSQGANGFGNNGQSGTFGANGQSGTFGANGQSSTFGANGQSSTFGANGQSGTFGANGQSGTFGANGQGFGTTGSFGSGQGSTNRGVTVESSSSTYESSRGTSGNFGNNFGANGAGTTGASATGSSGTSFGSNTNTNRFGAGANTNRFGAGANTNRFGTTGFDSTSNSNNANEVSYTTKTTKNFIETDSFSSGSENNGIYRPGAVGLKPGIPYLPPVNPTTTPRPTYLPPSTSAPGYLPPVGEQSINRETILPKPNPTYDEGSLILDDSRQPRPKATPPPSVNDIPSGCAAALKCTPIEYCTSDGVISNTTVVLTRDQEAYRVPLTDCKDLSTGRIGKCCRDPYYTDPWPVNQLGKWVPGVFGGDDGKYSPDSRGSSNNIRASVTVRPPITGSTILNNYRTASTPSFGLNQVTPGPVTQKNQFEIRGQGQYSQTGQGQYTKGGQGQYTKGGQGQFAVGAQGQVGQNGQIQGQFGQTNQGGQSQIAQGSTFNQNTQQFQSQSIFQKTQGQGALVNQGQGLIGSRGQGQLVSQGQGALVSQGQAGLTSQNGGALASQGQGSFLEQGQGQYSKGGRGQFGIGGQVQLESQSQDTQSQYSQVQGQAQKNFGQTGQRTGVIQGQGQRVNQEFGTGIKQGQGFSVNQGSGFGVENESSESVQRVFLSQYNAGGQCGVLNGQKPYGNRNELEVDFAEIPWQAMVLLQTNKSLLCGGVITRPDVVITTAACVDGLLAKNVLIKGGEWKLGIDDEPLPFQIVQVKTILRHPFYKRGSYINDVAILVLAENLRFAKNIYPICLPGPGQTLDAFYNGAGECIVTGWGKQVLQAHLQGSIMRSVNVSLINPGECQAKISQDYPHLLEYYDQESCACGQPTNPVNNICRTDIGSALACTTGDGHFVLRGVYSWDSGCQPGNQLAAFYKFDLEWYQWAIGLIESVRFAQFGGGATVSQSSSRYQSTSSSTGGFKAPAGGVKGAGSAGIKGGFGAGGFGAKGQFGFGNGQSQFSNGQSQFSNGQSQFSNGQSQFSNGQFSSKFSESSNGNNGNTKFTSQIGAPITNSFSASYSEKKVFQSEPKIITYTTKPEIVTFTTKPEIFTFTTKPKLVTYTTKPEFIRYETSGSGTNPQYVAPGVTYNPAFPDVVGAHSHNAQCKCNGRK